MFSKLIERVISFGNSNPDIQAVVIIGSQARTDRPADKYSDLDMLLVVSDAEKYIGSTDWLSEIGDVKVTFMSKTVTGTPERRTLFDGGLDVDIVILSDDDMRMALQMGDVSILRRGYKIIVDKLDIAKLVPPIDAAMDTYVFPTQVEFDSLVQTFFYQGVWTAKKLLRGELWMTLNSLDGYMPQMLLSAIECHSHALHGAEYDTWHMGRFIESWSEKWVANALSDCYSRFERDDAKEALLSMMSLFSRVMQEAAEKLNYFYPKEADEYSRKWVADNLFDC